MPAHLVVAARAGSSAPRRSRPARTLGSGPLLAFLLLCAALVACGERPPRPVREAISGGQRPAAASPDGPAPGATHPYFGDGGFLVVAHRGGRGLGPEGTLPVFRRAVELGVDVLEMDVRQSADGALVVFHDAGVERVTD
ncbi:MAG: glycerophosphodiester phosphodiesterase family protein [Candidatus Latescibacterota bacterium]